MKNQRIKELRAALELATASRASSVAAAAPPPSREAFVLEQRLSAAERQAANLKALNANLEHQLKEAHKARREAQAQVASARAQLALAEQGAATAAELATAKEQVSTLSLQLASRNAVVAALQSQLATFSSRSSRCRSACTQTSDGPACSSTVEALLGPPPLLPAAVLAGASGDAFSSLERIVGLWKQACDAKDGQLQELHEELMAVST